MTARSFAIDPADRRNVAKARVPAFMRVTVRNGQDTSVGYDFDPLDYELGTAYRLPLDIVVGVGDPLPEEAERL